MTFAFDEQFAMFDITAVENQFILEYLPGAKGDYVKVYLYGLLCCYHPKKEMDIGSMSRELGVTEEEILTAFRYWERKGIVRRVRDHPPEWQYVNIKQKNLVTDDAPDADYIRFSREVENCFEGIRVFHGSEMAACYEWTEDLHLPVEVVLMLLKHMARTRGKSFRIRDAEKVAILLSDEKAFTAEDAEQILSRDEAMNSGFRKVLRKMGKKYNPSDANIMLYSKWINEWRFTHDAVEAACGLTGKNDPSLALLDSILDQIRNGTPNAESLERSDVERYEREREHLREVLAEMGQFGPAAPDKQKMYSAMEKLYPQKIILMAAKECAAKQSSFESVLKLLESWSERGFTTEEQITAHIRAFHEKEDFLKSLRKKWAGRDADPGLKAMQLLDKWEDELDFSHDMISLAADMAFEAKKPVSYMDKLLTTWAEKNIRTPEEAKKGQQLPSEKTSKTVTAQQYTQRDYTGEQDEAMRRMLEMNGDGGNA